MDGLTVLTKWEDMAAYAYVALKNYPKSERHTLAARTVNALIDAGAAIQRVGLIGDKNEKRFLLQEADRNIARFKLMVRLGVKLGFIRHCTAWRTTLSVIERAAYRPKGDQT